MASATSQHAFAGGKRSRDDDDELLRDARPSEKRQRPTIDAGGVDSWHYDSVLNTPTASSRKPRYESDDQSSMVSEPGSPQDLATSSGDEMDMDAPSFSDAPDDLPLPTSQPHSGSPWRGRMQAKSRVPTPFGPPSRPDVSPMQVRTGFKQHVRRRHPQENLSSDHLELPSPIDEDEVPTPPSAAEAAGSQLSMLSVNDMDIETAEDVPSITIDPARSLRLEGQADSGPGTPDFDAMDGDPTRIMVRKQRQRSGAQSNGSVSPVRPSGNRETGMGGKKERFSMGYRADCIKCQMRTPGHMNHINV